MKKWGRRLSLSVGIVLFIGCCLGITWWLTRTCIPYNAKAEKIEKTLYSDDADQEQTDICLIGGSHGINGFNPNILWETAGLRAYNYCYAGETIALSKAYLEELYKKRSFQLVVLEVYYAGIADPYFGEDSYAYDVLNKMKCSDAKSNYIEQHVSEEYQIEYLFPLYHYHNRWMSLEEQDFSREPDPTDDWKMGQDFHFEINDGKKVTFGPWRDRGQVCHLRDTVEQDLRDFITLAQSHGSQVLLVDLPRRYGDSLMPARWIRDEYAVVNRVKQIAEEYGVEVLQYDEEGLESIGFVPEKHMYNRGHMNIIGSEVYSRALANYIVENYNVTANRTPEDIREGYLATYQQQRKAAG